MFRTPATMNSTNVLPLHPAYENSPSAHIRKLMTPEAVSAAPEAIEGAQRFYNASLLEKPPLHLALGKLAIQMATEQYTEGLEETKQYAEWSAPFAM